MTNEEILRHIAKFYAAYELILTEPITLDDIKRALIIGGMPETSARRYVSDIQYPACKELLVQTDDRKVQVDHEGAEHFIFDLAEWFQVDIIPMSAHAEEKEELLKTIKRDSDVNANLTEELHDAYHSLKMQKIKAKEVQDNLDILATEKQNVQDLYDVQVAEMNSLCASPKRLLKQFIVALINQHIKKKSTETQQ